MAAYGVSSSDTSNASTKRTNMKLPPEMKIRNHT